MVPRASRSHGETCLEAREHGTGSLAICMTRWYARWGAGVATVAMLTGCGGDGGETSAPLPTVLPTAVASLTPVPVSLGEVTWSTGVDETTGAPVDSLTTLPHTAPAIYAVVPAAFLPAGASIQAHWTIDGSPLRALQPEPIVVEEDREDAWLSWSLAPTAEESWPVGSLGIDLEIDGEIVAASQIMIVWDRDTDGG